MRVGIGYDVHKLIENRKLILGGVEIEHDKGLLGHSDADVLVHAMMDSILGALALGDIGKHFPDTDPKYKGADSIKLLEFVNNLIESINPLELKKINPNEEIFGVLQQMFFEEYKKISLNDLFERVPIKRG